MIGIFKLLTEILFALVVAAALGYAGYLFFTNEKIVSIEAQFLINERFAKTYYSRIQTYDGLCGDIKLPSEYVCRSDGDKYRIYQVMPVSTSGVYCIDATGFAGRVETVRRNEMTCR